MHNDIGIKLELNQKLMMTPELRQAIAILQISFQELSTVVEEALVENPVLEAEESKEEEVFAEIRLPLSYIDEHEEYESTSMADTKSSPETYLSKPVSLEEHLKLQLDMHLLNKEAHAAGLYLIGCLDDNGYLTMSTNEISQMLEVSQDVVLEVLKIIQTFDPPGIGARNLSECLSIQAVQKGLSTTLVLAVIDKYLEDVAAGRYKLIANELNSSILEVQQAVDVIKSFNPKPAQNFSDCNQNRYIYPDITVKAVDGEFVIILNNSLPTLYINPEYRRILSAENHDAKNYISGCINSAVWLIKSIEQRERTLYKVMEAIILLQRDFFDKGPKYLKPMTLKDIAERIDMHESTVSRASANKYVDTPYGLYSIKSFFSTGLKSITEGSLPRTNVKKIIKEIIENEDSKAPLTDQKIAEILDKKNIVISRRTVAKYREELGILSAKQRKRY